MKQFVHVWHQYPNVDGKGWKRISRKIFGLEKKKKHPGCWLLTFAYRCNYFLFLSLILLLRLNNEYYSYESRRTVYETTKYLIKSQLFVNCFFHKYFVRFLFLLYTVSALEVHHCSQPRVPSGQDAPQRFEPETYFMVSI